MVFKIRVLGLAGLLCTFEADDTSSLDEVKESIEIETRIPALEQRLFNGTQELIDPSLFHACLRDASTSNGFDLSLVRRIPEQAEWLAEVAVDWKLLRKAPQWVKGDAEIVTAAVRQNGYTLQFASEDLRADRGVVSVAVKQNGRAMWFATDELRADRDIVWAAVQQNVRAWRFAAASLREDRDLVLAVAKMSGEVLEFFEADQRADAEIVLAAVRQYGRALQFAARDLQCDHEVVLAAVNQDGSALEFAVESLRADASVVLAAVTQHGPALQFASDPLRADVEIVSAAVRQSEDAKEFAAEGLWVDRAVMNMALMANGRSHLSSSSSSGRPQTQQGEEHENDESEALTLQERLEIATHWRLEPAGLVHRFDPGVRPLPAPPPCHSCRLGRHIWCPACGPAALEEAREVMRRLFDKDSEAVEREGKKVNKFIGGGLSFTTTDLQACAFKGVP